MAIPEFPARGVIFWPVGNGDATTIVVNENTVVQVDLNDIQDADNDEDPRIPVVDALVERLPNRDGRPYLAAFALTHADADHARGFEELLERVVIGELWFTPRVLQDFDSEDGLSNDAQAFCDEAMRRIRVTVNTDGDVEPGDLVRVVGYANLLKEDEFSGLPPERLTVPGNAFTRIGGVDFDGTFRAFVHAPFKDDGTAERNTTSLGLQITLTEGDATCRLMLLGDLDYPPIKRIFDISDAADVAWDVFLAPHHCSKGVMYFADDHQGGETPRQELLYQIEASAGDTGWVVASCSEIPASNQPGDNPPHAKARDRYEEIAPGGFAHTGDQPDPADATPIVVRFGSEGIEMTGPAGIIGTSEARDAIEQARGGKEPHGTTVGFGAC